MQATHRPSVYDVNRSVCRIDTILNGGDNNYTELFFVPSEEKLTFENGYYVNVTALFIDMVDSSELTKYHYRPVLAKIYRSFISECIDIINAEKLCKSVNINGDCVWGIFETNESADFDSVIDVAGCLTSMLEILNAKLSQKGYVNIKAGIGIDYGRALMIKTGYRGSSLNDVIWMGDVVNHACHLANHAHRYPREMTLITDYVYGKICKRYKGFFAKFKNQEFCGFEGNVCNRELSEYLANGGLV